MYSRQAHCDCWKERWPRQSRLPARSSSSRGDPSLRPSARTAREYETFSRNVPGTRRSEEWLQALEVACHGTSFQAARDFGEAFQASSLLFETQCRPSGPRYGPERLIPPPLVVPKGNRKAVL